MPAKSVWGLVRFWRGKKNRDDSVYHGFSLQHNQSFDEHGYSCRSVSGQHSRSEKISGDLLGDLLDRVFALSSGKSDRHIHRAYVAADHLCGMRQMASACLIADADHLCTSRWARGDVRRSNQNSKLLLRMCGFHEGAGSLGRARDVQGRMHFSSQHFRSAALGEPRTSSRRT
jgi:hypothetical protein